MTQQVNQHSRNESVDTFIFEECHYCHIELEHIEDILVDDSDHYCCHECNTYYRLNAKVCREIY